MNSKEKRTYLENRLLRLAGRVAFAVDADYWIDKVLDEGRVFSGEDIVIEEGDAGKCHLNSINAHLKNPDLKVCTGFSINGDRWVRHSWCVDSEGKVHECTPIKREMYYGSILDEEDTILLRREWDYAYDAKLRREEEKLPFLREKLREAEDCKYFIRRCIDDSTKIDPEIESRRKDELDSSNWTALKGELYTFKESFFRSKGLTALDKSLTDYKKEAMEYLERTYPFCFNISLRTFEQYFYENATELELLFYAMALGACDEQIAGLNDMLKNEKLESITNKGSLKIDRRYQTSKKQVSLNDIQGSSVDKYSADNLFDALLYTNDKKLSGFVSYLMMNDYEVNTDKIFDGVCAFQDESGTLFVSEGNHRIIVAKALQAIKRYIKGDEKVSPINLNSTITRIKFLDQNTPQQNTWEL